MNKIGVYIHIPFCKSRCFYCDFYSTVLCNDGVEEYIAAVCEEIIANSELLQERQIETVYFGGGTPSVIDTKYIIRILDMLKLYTPNISEITVEVNPESVTIDKLQELYDAGVNRLSIGLQSANNKTLKTIGRLASIEDFNKAYEAAIKVGFNNISCDLIIGLPDETIDMFSNTLNFVLAKDKITHISAYSLEVHEGTKLDFLIKNGFCTLPDEDTEREMKYLLDKKLADNGYTRYEISNYAKEGYCSKHNLLYWNQKEYIGLGAAAASFINSTRYTNVKDIKEYKAAMKNGSNIREDIEELDGLATIREYVILKLRLKEGVNLNEFKLKFKRDIYSLFNEQINKLIQEGLLQFKNGALVLTYKGEDLANLVWQEFI